MDSDAKRVAQEVGKQHKGGGWYTAFLIACYVEPDTGSGGDAYAPRTGKTSGKNLPLVSAGQKVSANEFAKEAGMSRPTLMLYYNAWELAAEEMVEGIVPASELPRESTFQLNIETLPSWSEFYNRKEPNLIDEAICRAATNIMSANKVALEKSNKIKTWKTTCLRSIAELNLEIEQLEINLGAKDVSSEVEEFLREG